MQRIIAFVLPIATWLGLTVLLLSLIGPTMNIIDYSLIDPVEGVKSPFSPDYARVVALSDIVLSMVGSAGVALSLTNFVYNVRCHTKYIRGFVIGLLVGILLIVIAAYVFYLLVSTCYPTTGTIPGLYPHEELLYCGVPNIDNAVAMTEIFRAIIWIDLGFGVSLSASAIVLIFVYSGQFRASPKSPETIDQSP